MEFGTQSRCRIFFPKGEKFRTDLLVVLFDLPLERKTATKTALLAELLQNRSPLTAAKAAEELYGADWQIGVVKKGDRQLLLFSLETLKMVGATEMLSFLKERLISPLAEGGFAEQEVERQKKRLKQRLKARQEDKPALARRRALEEAAKGTAIAVSGDGYLEDLDEIGGEELFDWYQSILKTASVQVYFCGDPNGKREILSLRQLFSGTIKEEHRQKAVGKANRKPRFLQEPSEAAQARLVLGFCADTGSTRRETALLLLSRILGEGGDSLLFQQMREEAGLCYAVRSYCYPLSPYFFIEAGIQETDVKEASRMVGDCIRKLREEGIPLERVEEAKNGLRQEYEALADDPWRMIDFFAEQCLAGRAADTTERLRQIDAIEPEEIRQAAGRLQLEAIYVLGGKEEKHGAE